MVFIFIFTSDGGVCVRERHTLGEKEKEEEKKENLHLFGLKFLNNI